MSKSVLLTPFSPGGNEYKELLKSNLEDAGITCYTDENPSPVSVLKNVIRDKPDVLHLHWTHSFFLPLDNKTWKTIIAAIIFVPELLLASLLVERVVWTIHNKQNHEKKHVRIEYAINRFVSLLASKIQVWDEHTKNEAAEYFSIPEEKLVVIPQGNYREVYPNPPDKAEAREELGLEQYERVLLHFGNLRPYKGTIDLIESFKELSGSDDCLIVAGKGSIPEYFQEIEEAASEPNVILDEGFIEKENLLAYIGAADYMVFNFKSVFNSGGVVLALSLGKAIAGPKKGILSSLQRTSNIIESNTNQLVEKALNSDKEIINQVERDNLQLSKTEHDWDLITEKIIEEVYG